MDKMDDMDMTPNYGNRLSFTSSLCFNNKKTLLFFAFLRVLCGL